MIRAILKQARRYYDYVVPQFCHAQFYTVKSGALMPAGNCAAGSAFFLSKLIEIQKRKRKFA